jgi:drug/metabolite transporter (DMT)-like permease
MLLNNLTPVFTTLGGWLFLNKRFDQKFLVGMVIALCGALALGLEDLNNLEGNLEAMRCQRHSFREIALKALRRSSNSCSNSKT